MRGVGTGQTGSRATKGTVRVMKDGNIRWTFVCLFRKRWRSLILMTVAGLAIRRDGPMEVGRSSSPRFILALQRSLVRSQLRRRPAWRRVQCSRRGGHLDRVSS